MPKTTLADQWSTVVWEIFMLTATSILAKRTKNQHPWIDDRNIPKLWK